MSLKRKIIILILISIGLFIPVISKYEKYVYIKEEQENIKKFLIDNNNTNTYLMVLNIPKINLNKGIYNIVDKNNNVSENIEILSSSNLDNNTIILAAHSGTASNAYFNNLNKLSINDILYIYYNQKKYTYIIKDMYYIPKKGYLKIEKNISNTLILITCSTIYNDKQIIITSYLENISML